MKKLYEKNELTFAIVWIVVYCVLQSLANMQLPVAQKNRNGAIRRVVISIRTVLRENCAIEQFQNPQMAQLQTKQNYTDVMHYFTGFVRFLIRQGRLADSDPEIMAA